MLIPTQVWLGPKAVLEQELINFLQKKFCLKQGCGQCVSCRKVSERDHFQIQWLPVADQYRIDDVRAALERLNYKLAAGELFYFIFQDAHLLNQASANSLLKAIEEPSAGYNFIFLTNRKELLLATIVSRSAVRYFHTSADLAHPLVNVFSNPKLVNAVEFCTILDQQSDIGEENSFEILDQIYQYWLMQAKSEQPGLDQSKIVGQMLNLIQSQQLTPPMPGSSKLFWKNFYLQASRYY